MLSTVDRERGTSGEVGESSVDKIAKKENIPIIGIEVSWAERE